MRIMLYKVCSPWTNLNMEYKNAPSQDTLAEIERVLAFIRKHSQGLIEKSGDSKWTHGYCLFCNKEDAPGFYTHMVGALKNGKVTWHIMPLYGVAELKEKWPDALKPFVSGKSCIQFNRFSDLPHDAILDIVQRGGPLFREVMLTHLSKKKSKKG